MQVFFLADVDLSLVYGVVITRSLKITGKEMFLLGKINQNQFLSIFHLLLLLKFSYISLI